MIRKKISGIFKNEDGAGLVLALMVLVVLAVLGLAVGSVTVGSYKLGAINRDSNSAYYIAEAGANLAYEEIKNGVMPAYTSSSNNESNFFTNIAGLTAVFNPKVYAEETFELQFGDQPQATVEISDPQEHAEGKLYTIISTGEIGGKIRIVEKSFLVKWMKKGGFPELPKAALIAKSELNLESKKNKPITVIGDIILGENGEKSVGKNFNHYELDGETTNIKGIQEKNVDIKPYIKILDDVLNDLKLTYSSNMPAFPDKTDHDEWKIEDNFTFDTRNAETINLVVNKLTIKSNITIIGDGIVNIYVRKELSFDTKNKDLNINQGGSTKQLNFFCQDDVKVKAEKNWDFTGNITAKKVEIEVAKECIFTGNITTVSDVKFKKDAIVKGNITAGGNVEFEKDAYVDGNIIAGDDVEFKKDAYVEGNIIAGDDVEFEKDAIVKGIIIAKEEVEFEKDLEMDGIIIAGDEVEFQKNTNFTGTNFATKIKSEEDSTFTYADKNHLFDDFPYIPGDSGSAPTLEQLISAEPAVEPKN